MTSLAWEWYIRQTDNKSCYYWKLILVIFYGSTEYERKGRQSFFPEKTVNKKSLFSSESLFVGSVYFLGTFLCCDRRQLVKSWEVLIDLLHFPQTDVRMFQEYKIALKGVQENNSKTSQFLFGLSVTNQFPNHIPLLIKYNPPYFTRDLQNNFFQIYDEIWRVYR